MKLYVDENMPRHLANGFQVLQEPEGFRTGKPIEVIYLPDAFRQGIQDEEWILKMELQDCVITQDFNIHRRKHQLELYQNRGIGMFFLRGPNKKKGLSVWGMVQILAKHWPEITRLMYEGERPFAYLVSTTGLKRI